jgi:hypothetical protein
MSTLATLSNIFSIFLCAVISGFVFRVVGFKFFTFHPILMTFAYIGVATQGILIIRSQSNIFTIFCPRESKNRKMGLLLHTLTQIFATYLLLAGFGVIYYDKIRFEKPHFSRYFNEIEIEAFVCECYNKQ